MVKKRISNWDAIVEASKSGSAIYVGVDVHKNKYAVAVLSSEGVQHQFITVADNEGLIRQFTERGIEITGLAYEAGLTGFGLYRACRGAGVEVMVVAACRMPRPAARSAKTDKIDGLKLAEYLSKGMLRPIAVPSEEQEADRAEMRRRNQLTREVAEVKARIRSFLTFHGLPEPAGLKTWRESGLDELSKLQLRPRLRSTLDSLLRQLNFLIAERRLLEKEIKMEILPAEDVLQSVPGVGPVTSAAFRTEIFEPERFERSEQLASFVGLAPIISQSGEKEGTSKMIPCGQGKLRSMLIEAAWVLLRKEAWAADFYQRILRRSGKSQKAICALARKLTVILWKLLQDNRYYRSDYASPEEFTA
jgi:transposase